MWISCHNKLDCLTPDKINTMFVPLMIGKETLYHIVLKLSFFIIGELINKLGCLASYFYNQFKYFWMRQLPWYLYIDNYCQFFYLFNIRSYCACLSQYSQLSSKRQNLLIVIKFIVMLLISCNGKESTINRALDGSMYPG